MGLLERVRVSVRARVRVCVCVCVCVYVCGSSCLRSQAAALLGEAQRASGLGLLILEAKIIL